MNGIHKRLLVLAVALCGLTLALAACHKNDTPLEIRNETHTCVANGCPLTVDLMGNPGPHNYNFPNLPVGNTDVGVIDSGPYLLSTQSACHNLAPTQIDLGPGPFFIALFCSTTADGGSEIGVTSGPIQ